MCQEYTQATQSTNNAPDKGTIPSEVKKCETWLLMNEAKIANVPEHYLVYSSRDGNENAINALNM